MRLSVLVMTYDIVVMGASAGGVQALQSLVRALPEDFPASVFIVLHMSAEAPSLLAEILNREKGMPVVQAADGAPIGRARIYVANPDHHLLIERGYMRVTRGPRENRHRPAIDPLFRSAARAYGPRVVGVLLSGLLDDGTSGLEVIKARGGISVVQDPEEAQFSSMPAHAIENDSPDYSLPVAEIARLLVRLSKQAARPRPIEIPLAGLDKDVKAAEADMSAINGDNKTGVPSAYSCPECNGVLWEVRQGENVRFRCRVGHAYALNSLGTAKSAALEGALWTALRCLEERISLERRMADSALAKTQPRSAEQFRQSADEKQKQAAVIRDMLVGSMEPEMRRTASE